MLPGFGSAKLAGTGTLTRLVRRPALVTSRRNSIRALSPAARRLTVNVFVSKSNSVFVSSTANLGTRPASGQSGTARLLTVSGPALLTMMVNLTRSPKRTTLLVLRNFTTDKSATIGGLVTMTLDELLLVFRSVTFVGTLIRAVFV